MATHPIPNHPFPLNSVPLHCSTLLSAIALSPTSTISSCLVCFYFSYDERMKLYQLRWQEFLGVSLTSVFVIVLSSVQQFKAFSSIVMWILCLFCLSLLSWLLLVQFWGCLYSWISSIMFKVNPFSLLILWWVLSNFVSCCWDWGGFNNFLCVNCYSDCIFVCASFRSIKNQGRVRNLA